MELPRDTGLSSSLCPSGGVRLGDLVCDIDIWRRLSNLIYGLNLGIDLRIYSTYLCR